MIRKLTGLLLALALILCAAALPAAALESALNAPAQIRSEEPPEDPTEPPATEAPTEQPTEAPTEVPTEAPTEKPTEKPTDAPATPAPTPWPTSTPKPTNSPRPTNAPTGAPTNAPTSAPITGPTSAPTSIPTSGPTGAPTQPPSYIAYPLWEKASDTIIKVPQSAPFDITLVEGLSDYITYSDFYGNFPATVEFVNEFETTGRCAVRGTLNVPGPYEFAVEFMIRTGAKVRLNFSLSAAEDVQTTPDPDVFPEGRPLVPFGAFPTASAPAIKRKEDA